MPARPAPASVAAYLADADAPVRERLADVRATIRAAVPEAEEKISYRMPAYKLDGRVLLYFAAHTAHIGVYPVAKGDDAFEAALAPYRAGKAALRLPHAAPLPLDLVRAVALRRAEAVRQRGPGRQKGPATA